MTRCATKLVLLQFSAQKRGLHLCHADLLDCFCGSHFWHACCGQVAVLVALQQGGLQQLAPEVLQMRLRIFVHCLRRTHSQELRSIGATQALSEADAAVLASAYHAVCRQFEWT